MGRRQAESSMLQLSCQVLEGLLGPQLEIVTNAPTTNGRSFATCQLTKGIPGHAQRVDRFGQVRIERDHGIGPAPKISS
jgi:hypothetical protein